MERRKLKAQSQLQKLKGVSEVTVELLNKIILTSSKYVNELEKLDTKDFRLHSKFFLAGSQFHYASHQKLLELNVDLELHLLENNPPGLEDFKLVNCGSGSSASFVNREYESNILSPTGSIESEPLLSKEGEEPIKPNNDVVLYKVSLDRGKNTHGNGNENSNGLQKCLSTISLLSQKNTIGAESNEQNEEAYKAFIGTKLTEKSASTSSLLSEADTKFDKTESSSDYLNCISNQDTKNQNSREPVKSVDPLRITERLKSLPVMSAEEKWTENLPMPDLSRNPAQLKSKSASSNNNTSSKSSINSVLKNVIQKRKKKRLRVRRNKENETANEVFVENRSETKIVEIQIRPVPKVGDVCMIGLMESPSKFYIQVADENIDLVELWSDQLEDIYGNSYSPFSSKTEAANVMGNFGCLQIQNYWYRVEVIDWKMDATGDDIDMVRVQLVDYGNKDVYSYHQLRPLSDEFCHVPKMAQLCHLAYLYPPGSTKQHRKKNWSKKSLGSFYSMCGDLDHSYFRISHIQVCESRKSFEVDIVKLHDHDEEHSIGQILINSGFAVEIIDDVTEVMRNHAMMDQIRTTPEIQSRPVPKVGDVCMIGLMESPSKFYIQVADENIDMVDLWSHQLEDIYGNSYSPFSSKTEAANVMGNFGCLQIQNFWYRVEVIDWKMDETGDDVDMVRVQLVDYGNKDVYSYCQLRPLSNGFCYVPKMAQLCHLAYLYPPGSTKQHRKKNWSKKSLGGFYSMCEDLDHSYFRISHIYVCESRKSFEVDIVKLHDNDEQHSIGQILINSGFAVQIIDDVTKVMRNHAMMDQIRTTPGIQGLGSDMSKEEILERYFQYNIAAEAPNTNEAVIHYNPRDEAETCRNLCPDGTCYKGQKCKLRHVPLRDGFTRDREVVYQEASTNAPLPRINDEILLTISHIEDIQCFYAQMRTEVPTIINQLVKTMNSADNIKMYKNLQHPPCPNQLVIAKHWNTYWYRAQVQFVQIPENNDEVMTEVYFVDFGDKLKVPMSDLRIILPDFLQLPFQALECRLFNVKHKDDLDREEEKRYFELRYLGETVRAKVVSAVPGHIEVLLKNDRDEDVGLQLIENGYGVLNTTSLQKTK